MSEEREEYNYNREIRETAVKREIYRLATNLIYLWVHNLETDQIEFTVKFDDVGMRTDIPRTRGKVVKITAKIVEE